MKRVIIEHYKNNRKKYLFLFMAYILGTLLGYLFLSFCTDEMIKDLGGFMSENIKLFLSQSETLNKSEYFGEVMFKESLSFLLMWVLGLSSLGVFFAPTFLVYKGYIFGFSCAFMLKCYDGEGLLFALTVLLSQNLIKVPVLVFACMCTISHSLKKMPSVGKSIQSPSSLMFVYSLYMLFAFVFYCIGIYFECYIVPHFVFILGENMI